jgi:hypothetical protein
MGQAGVLAGQALAARISDIVEEELKGFSERERAWREGLREWELDYIVGRIYLRVCDRLGGFQTT